jgi:hypothetical protein
MVDAREVMRPVMQRITESNRSDETAYLAGTSSLGAVSTPPLSTATRH